MSGGSTAMAVMLTNASAAMDGVRAETLVLWGENDTIAPLRTARILESRIAGRLVVLPDVGHVPMREATEATLRHITEHLDPSSGGLGMRGVSSQGQVVCEGERGVEYRGTMHSLSLRDCHDVRIEDASIGQLIVEHSDGFMTNTEVGATFVSGAPTGSGLQLTRGSTFVVTGGTIQGEVAIALDQSRLDIAGTVIEATEMPFTVRAKSRVLFSSVRVSGPGGVTHAHGSVNLSQ